MILIFHNKASCLLMVLFCFLIIQQSKAQSMRQNKTQLVPATSVAVLKSNFNRDETVKVVYHKPNRSLHNLINNDVLSNNVVISGVDIINGKSNAIKYNQVNATELVKAEATSLIDYDIPPYSKASKTTISGVDLIKGKDPIIYPDEKQNIELIADEQNESIEDSFWNVFSKNRAAEYEAEHIADLEESEVILAQQFENQRISDSLAEAAQLAEFEGQRLADQAAAKLLAEEEENQRISDSLAEAAQLAEFEARQLAEESAAKLLAEEEESQRISDSLAEAVQLAEFEAQQLAEESAAKLLAEEQKSQRIADSIVQVEQLAELEQQRKEEEARLLAEQLKNKRISDSLAELRQLGELEQQRKEEEARLLAEQMKNKRISDSLAEIRQLAELEQQRKEEEARLLAEQMKNKRISDSLAEIRQLAELEQQRKEEEARLLAEQMKNKRISDSLAELRQLAELEQQRKEVETRLLADKQKMTEENNQILAKSQRTNDAVFSDMYTAPNTEFNEYYTIKLTTVYSPMEGISFLNNVRDGDEIWKENAFHLYQDEYNSDLTNISIGKFSSLDEADIIINKLKNKGLTNAKAIKYSNKMKLKTATNSVKKKSVSNPVVKTSVVKPIKNTVVNNSPKTSVNSTNENLAIKTSPKPSVSTINSSVNNENKPKEIKDVKKENPFSNISKEVSQDQDFFTVQLAAVSEITSDRINTISLDKKQLFYQNINAGNYALNYKKYSNYGEAHAKAIELHGKGFEGAYVTKYVNNKRITVTKSDLANDKVSESTIEADLRSLGYKPLDFNRKGKYIQIGSFYNWDSHSYEDSYGFINHSIYYMVDQSHVVKFLIGPFSDRDLFIELRNVKKQINDAFIKTI